jgi:hypothetical protein
MTVIPQFLESANGRYNGVLGKDILDGYTGRMLALDTKLCQWPSAVSIPMVSVKSNCGLLYSAFDTWRANYD